jgi:hypothetical protein
VVEFKRGSENPDVRKVVAQLLDYGSSLWRLPFEELERRCVAAGPAQADLDTVVADPLPTGPPSHSSCSR